MILGFSNKILLDEIYAGYDLLVMNGSKISLQGGSNVEIPLDEQQEGLYYVYVKYF